MKALRRPAGTAVHRSPGTLSVPRPRPPPQGRWRPNAAAIGPEPPPTSRGGKPAWVRILEEDAEVDEDVADLLRGTAGDPEAIQAKMEARLQNRRVISERSGGSDKPPLVVFREVDQFDLWVWLETAAPLTAGEQELLSSALKSWFIIGKLGGYNAQNMQVYTNSAGDLSYMDYDNEELQGAASGGGGGSTALAAFMHEMGDPEFNGAAARFQ